MFGIACLVVRCTRPDTQEMFNKELGLNVSFASYCVALVTSLNLCSPVYRMVRIRQ